MSIFSWKNHDLGFLRLQWSSIVISKVLNHDFFMKILTKSTFLRKHTPQMLLSASFGVLWTNIGKKKIWPKMGFQHFHFPPIIKSMFSLYNINKGGEARFSTEKFWIFGSGLVYSHYRTYQWNRTPSRMLARWDTLG